MDEYSYMLRYKYTIYSPQIMNIRGKFRIRLKITILLIFQCFVICYIFMMTCILHFLALILNKYLIFYIKQIIPRKNIGYILYVYNKNS